MVLELIRRVRDKGLPVVLISHNMPHVFEIADRIHIQRLGKRQRWSTRSTSACPTRWPS
jgi:fructose transport system ATP-binding protein